MKELNFCKSLILSATLLFSLVQSTASQEQSQEGVNGLFGVDQLWNQSLFGGVVIEENLLTGAGIGEVENLVSEYGYDLNSLPGIDTNVPYNLQKYTIAPGEVGFIARPALAGAGAKSIILSPGTTAQNAVFGVNTEQIRTTIVQAVDATIEELCNSKAVPSKIKATASAGVVSFELEWNSAEVCTP